jgi:DNA polymerase-1
MNAPVVPPPTPKLPARRRKKPAPADDLFPSLEGQGLISLDCETCDPELMEEGPGWHRDGTFIAGVAIGTEAGFRRYYPLAHEGGGNVDRARALEWLNAQLRGDTPKVGANLSYDLGFLNAAGVQVGGPLYDIQIAEPLLNENRFQYGLDVLAKDYLGVGKVDDELDEFLKKNFGRKNPKGNIWRAPPEIVAPYAIGDIDLPLRIFAKQKVELEKQGLWKLFEMEIKLTRMLVAMRKRGVRVDLPKAERMMEELTKKQEELEKEVKRQSGFSVNVWAAKSLAPVFDEMGVPYPRTPKTDAPSITKEFLEACEAPIAKLILEIRQLDKLRGTFLRGSILERHYKGRVHCQFHPLKGDNGGAVSGRFSSSNPNLQFISVRTELGKEVRSVFIPDEGQDMWDADFSQIEYRLMVHDAASLKLPGSAEVVAAYLRDSKTDFHQVVAEMAKIDRNRAKTINFGIAYGEGKAKLAASLGMTMKEVEALLDDYHSRAPFMKPLSKMSSGKAGKDGLIITLLGRRRRFDSWVIEKRNRETGEKEAIILRHYVRGAKRAFTHKALNARIQGSAADIMKKAMVDIMDSGVMDVLGVPQITVHDELVGSVPRTKKGKEAVKEVVHLMENCVKLAVPLIVDCKTGANWREAH